MNLTINLTHEPDTVKWPETHYVYVELVGNIPQNAQKAWKTVEVFASKIAAQNTITGAAALYKTGPGIYRAGFMLAAAPRELPEGLQYQKLPGGEYARFVLNGPYDQLPEATRLAFQIVAEKKIALRDDFNIEHYVTDPRSTPPDQSITAILFPKA
jgi:predicted transcriptional regulator YdeE